MQSPVRAIQSAATDSELTAQVDMLKERLKGKEAKMAEKDQRIEDLEQEKAHLQNRVDELEKTQAEDDQQNGSTSPVNEGAESEGSHEVEDVAKQQDSIDEATVPANASSQGMSREELLSMLPEADRARQEEYIDIVRAKTRDVIRCLPTGYKVFAPKGPKEEKVSYNRAKTNPAVEAAIKALWDVMRVDDCVEIKGEEDRRHWDVTYYVPSTRV